LGNKNNNDPHDQGNSSGNDNEGYADYEIVEDEK
jgi:hypothetical protein